jgi:mono/diheme cytochrome c family protein
MRIIVFIIILVLTNSCNILTQKENTKDIVFTKSIERGSAIYADFCVTCHLPNGTGVNKVFPPLAKSDYLLENREASIRAIKFGQKGEIIVNGVTYNNLMAPLGLANAEIADIMNYITNTWGNTNDKMITVEEISKIQP